MLRLLEKSDTDDRGFTRTGKYSLIIAEKALGVILATPTVHEITFHPNPTDIDDVTQFPNVIQPDQAGGFYLNTNEMGSKTIILQGTTGQKPVPEALDTLLGAGGSRITSVLKALPGRKVDNGYTIWVKLYNFFVKWSSLIKDDPTKYAMLFTNTKDACIYQVVPSSFRTTRTSARPLSYGYSIELAVIGEQKYVAKMNWLDRLNDIRTRIKQWQNAINNVALLVSELAQDNPFGPISGQIALSAITVQNLVHTAKAIANMPSYSHDAMTEFVNNIVEAENEASTENTITKPLTTTKIARNSLSSFIPPTAEAVSAAIKGTSESILDNATTSITQQTANEATNLNLDDDSLETYGNALNLMTNTYIAIDSSPLPANALSGVAGIASRDLHRTARAGGAGIIDGREDELASAALAGETTQVQDSVLGTETRHGIDRSRTLESYNISHLASTIVTDWLDTHNERIPPQLTAFRQWFLGMRDPVTFSPLYKNVTVNSSDTIYTLARQYLGSWQRWTEIALINNLQYPYITPEGGAYQKAPGEVIYIPIENASVPVSVIEDFFQVAETHDLLNIQQLFIGFDIEISGLTGDTVYSVYDVGHVGGQTAFEQEMSIVLEGSGGITSDRVDGPAIKIGTKSKGQITIDLWRTILMEWFSSDYRVSKVDWLSVLQQGDQVYYSVSLFFQNFDSAVTLAGSLRN